MNQKDLDSFATKTQMKIRDEDSNEEYFVHVSGLVDQIQEDDNVEFELKEGRKGLNAVNVKVI